MADIFSKSERSRIMGLIRSKNTKLEQRFLKLLSQTIYPKGARYRKHYKKLPGCPDIVFVSQKVAVFIDGDFWHGYNFRIQKAKLPKIYWVEKIRNNILRDKRTNRKLKSMGWKVIRIWEHDIKKNPLRHIKRIEELICST